MTGGTAGSHNGFWGGNLRNSGGDVLLDHVRVIVVLGQIGYPTIAELKTKPPVMD